MIRIAARVFAGLLLCGLAAPAIAADRTADEIVKEIEAIKRPTTRAEAMEGSTKRIALVGELLKSHPDDARLATLLPMRWSAMGQTGKADEALAEIAAILPKTKDETLKKKGPEVAASILYVSTMRMKSDDPKKVAVEERIIKDYGDTFYARMIQGDRKKLAAIGKPFELEFTDAIKGTTVSIKGLKGKVVVVDFWATWCGPCIDEMPNMKKLYAEYKDKGVEFIGVSLDQSKEKGGLDKLKKYVADNEIAWPQYYQGNYWESEFSSSWGIGSIPCIFIIDADGKLYSTEASRKLDTLIPEVLKKGKANGAGE
jgi:thiol-disulfide isomerase/thioredoxin